MSRLSGTIAIVAVCVALMAGCGGGDNAAPVPDGGNAHPDNATVTGRVVEADYPTVGLTRAIVTELSTGRSTETTSGGIFTLTGLPAGSSTQLRVEVPRSTEYNSATVGVPTRANATVVANIAVLPIAVGTPTSLAIDPQNASVESGGSIQFGATVQVGSQRVDVQPTWIVGGAAVGDISPTGLFGSQQAGAGFVRAIAGNLVQETAVTVTASAPPDISSVMLSAGVDNPIPATGGPLIVTAAVSDGNGVTQVHFDFSPQQGLPFTLTAVAPVAGTTRHDGTWRIVYNAPANSNRPDVTGRQAPQLYSVRVRAVDATGASTISDEWYDFAVAGVDTPPPPTG